MTRLAAHAASSEATTLLVDDCALLVSSLSRCLGRAGYVVITASTASSAEAKAGPFDCAIVDIELGDDDGVALAERLMRAKKVRRIVFYTGTADCGALRRASELGPVVLKDGLFAELILAVAGQVASAHRFHQGD